MVNMLVFNLLELFIIRFVREIWVVVIWNVSEEESEFVFCYCFVGKVLFFYCCI